MNSLYWLSALGRINSFGPVCIAAGLIIVIVIGIMTFFVIVLAKEEIISDDEVETLSKVKKKLIKISIPLLIIGSLINIFVPTTNELYTIYGVGTIIDYCKNNEKVKELPDNAVEALNKYLESLTNNDGNE